MWAARPGPGAPPTPPPRWRSWRRRPRRRAILAAEGVNAAQVAAVKGALTDAGAMADIVGPHLGALAEGVVANKTLANTDPVLYDAVLVPGGAASIQTLIGLGDAHNFVAQAYKHAKPIGALGEGTELLTASEIGRLLRAIAGPAAGAAQAPAGRPDAVQNLSEVGGMRLASGAGAQRLAEYGIVVGQNGGTPAALTAFVTALGHHRYWGRPNVGQVPA
ncbi:DJ-1/PfpI family protein [Deinococcus aestuarii]|uniref:DJ-1/PfpI family protein n=1 Tax=Deinococcus aestuarii TaxID=2774531 RepID=UPI0031B8ACFC